MNEQQQLIQDTLIRLLGDLCPPEVVDNAEHGIWAKELWGALTETGLTLAGIPEAAGGSGGDIEDSLLVIRTAARFAAPVPLAEHFIAALLLIEQGASVNPGPTTIADGDFEIDANQKLAGEAQGVAFARWCDEVIFVANSPGGPKLCRVKLADAAISESMGFAGEPRDNLSISLSLDATDVFEATENTKERIKLMGAATRGLMMSGALESALEMSVQYSMERSQFGRPIAKFQAIQQQLASMAGEVAASTMAGHALVEAFTDLDPVEIAMGKARISESVALCTDVAHQVHGAMGYTLEHSLNHRTRRLWCWRDEYGAEREWQTLIGQSLLKTGADGLWDQITRRC
jgi:acyl-CoA dehydrogenase